MTVANVLVSASDSNDVQPLLKTCKLQNFEVLTNNRHYSWVSTCQSTMSEQRLKDVICCATFTYSSNLSNKPGGNSGSQCFHT